MANIGTATIYLRVPPALADDLKRLAQRERTTVNHEATVALRAHIDADRQRRGGKR